MNRVVEEQMPPAVTREMLKEATAKDKVLKTVMEDVDKGTCRKSDLRGAGGGGWHGGQG